MYIVFIPDELKLCKKSYLMKLNLLFVKYFYNIGISVNTYFIGCITYSCVLYFAKDAVCRTEFLYKCGYRMHTNFVHNYEEGC